MRVELNFMLIYTHLIVSGSISFGDVTLGLLQSGRELDSIIHRCEACGRGYRHRENLKRHIRVECGKEAQFYCMFCAYRSKHKHDLMRHLKSRHPVSVLRY
jgi:hypothetical protein